MSTHRAGLPWRRRHPLVARALLLAGCLAVACLGLVIASLGGWVVMMRASTNPDIKALRLWLLVILVVAIAGGVARFLIG